MVVDKAKRISIWLLDPTQQQPPSLLRFLNLSKLQGSLSPSSPTSAPPAPLALKVVLFTGSRGNLMVATVVSHQTGANSYSTQIVLYDPSADTEVDCLPVKSNAGP